MWVCILLLAFGAAHGQSIGTFNSIIPHPQDERIHIPGTHAFDVLIQSGDPLEDGSYLRPRLDFTGFHPLDRSGTGARLGVNHEMYPGGVTFMDLSFRQSSHLWEITHSRPVDFSGLGSIPVAGTASNCSGAITPWNTFVTCEETTSGLDANGDGYLDLGWCIEVDIATEQVADYDGNGIQDKMWALGRMKHENVVVSPDSQLVYYGAEEPVNGFLFKLVLHEKGLLDSGDLYTLNIDSVGAQWRRIPNSTVADRNSVLSSAYFAGATNWARVEDVDIGPDGKVYFTSTIRGQVLRFSDMGDSIADFEIFIDYGYYPIVKGTDTLYEEFSWPDNLAFDGEGNLWITQDGGNSHVWVARPDHSASNPSLDVFMNTPVGCEPTGITFSEDYRFMFLSLQHPWGMNAAKQVDISGDTVIWNRDATMVIARREHMGPASVNAGSPLAPGVSLVSHFPNPTDHLWNLELRSEDTVSASLLLEDTRGRLALQREFMLIPGINLLTLDVADLSAGIYSGILQCKGQSVTLRLVVQK